MPSNSSLSSPSRSSKRTPAERLAQDLEVLHLAQREGVVQTAALLRTRRERLLQAGFLQEVVKGWFIVTAPALSAAPDGSSTAWYASFWAFMRQYLHIRFGDAYCLSPEASLLRHVQSSLIPRQVIVVTESGSNQVLTLPFGTSLLLYKDAVNFPRERVVVDGLQAMSLPLALCRVAPAFFRHSPADAEIALRLVRDPAPLLRLLLEGGGGAVAGRLAGAYAQLGEAAIAERITATVKAAGLPVRAVNPFQKEDDNRAGGTTALLEAGVRLSSPAAARIQTLWRAMRPQVLETFPAAPGLPANPAHYLAQAAEAYESDAYNSLSIEGYQVSPDLIARVRRGEWNPDVSTADGAQRDALAARGYFQAFQAVLQSLGRVLAADNAGDVVAAEHSTWYREMFAPAVQAGVLPATALAGYRSGAVYLRGSRHVPPSAKAVLDCLETLFELLRQESEASVRAILGHFLFVYIHPYPDGNGRIGRFLMNVLLASGGYGWTVIHQARRREYMNALEAASTEGNITPFAEFVRSEMQSGPGA